MQKRSEVKSAPILNERIDAYAATARTGLSARWKDMLGTWPVYAAAAASSLALTTKAEAGIIYSGQKNLTISATVQHAFSTASQKISTAFPGLPMPKFGAEVTDVFAPVATHYANRVGAAFIGNFAASTQAFAPGFQILRSASFAKNLGAGAMISAGAGNFGRADIENWHKNGANVGATGQFPPTATGFVGVRIVTSNAHDTADFGWIRLKVSDNGNGDGAPHKVTLVDWAYNNTPNAPIAAGDTGVAVPEPSAMALALLASGAAGVLAWRKKQQTTASTATRRAA
jgi:hypothetical protein